VPSFSPFSDIVTDAGIPSASVSAAVRVSGVSGDLLFFTSLQAIYRKIAEKGTHE
jgi:hypothetical protein